MYRLTALALAVVLMVPMAGSFVSTGSLGDNLFVQVQDKDAKKKTKKDGTGSQTPAPTGRKDSY